ncbi:uroporphyrinogen-III synthase [Acetobacteraceae bacterium]|nr:uroporphyrinogen-III synthase [Acetobacteraceae bacterium]
MKIVVTRPEPGLSETVDRLLLLNKTPVCSPLLAVEYEPVLPPMLGSSILVTSMHALPALMAQDRNTNILSVGEKTAQKARDLGFLRVFSANGTALDLAELFLKMNFSRENAWLAVGAGNDGRLYGELLDQRLGIQRIKAYQIRWCQSFSKNVLELLKSNEIKQFLFYSSETARAFLSLLEKERRSSKGAISLHRLEIFCLSKAIARVFFSSKYAQEWKCVQDNFLDIFLAKDA